MERQYLIRTRPALRQPKNHRRLYLQDAWVWATLRVVKSEIRILRDAWFLQRYILCPCCHFSPIKFQNIISNGAPTGSLGLTIPSGLMAKELFWNVLTISLNRLKFLWEKIRAFPGDLSLLLMDNVESHLNIKAVDYARIRGNCINILSTHVPQMTASRVMDPSKT